ncbi:MAG: hypothetical protein HY763_16190 [Planctomycetes bacterium]|nr:hypothetical protein [Planctomycetota bacterium]
MKRTVVTRLLLALGAGGALIAGTCTVDLRDAVVTGAMDYVSGTTTEILSSLITAPGEDEP